MVLMSVPPMAPGLLHEVYPTVDAGAKLKSGVGGPGVAFGQHGVWRGGNMQRMWLGKAVWRVGRRCGTGFEG